MNIGKFINFLSPTIERARIFEELDEVKRQLVENTLPQYKSAVEIGLFKGPDPFKSPQVKKFNRVYASETGARTNYVEAVCLALSKLVEGLPTFEKFLESHFKTNTISKSGLLYKQATLIRIISLMDFAGEYSRRILLYTYGKETPLVAKQAIEEPFKPGEVKWIEENAGNYARVMKILSMPVLKIIGALESMPDVVYDVQKESSIEAVVGAKKLDPLSMGFVPVISPVIMFFGTMWYERQAKRYLKSVEERNATELRLAQYKAARLGTPDAAQDKLIQITEGRLNDLNFEIVKMEKKMGI